MSRKGNPTTLIAAVTLCVIAVALLLWQFVFRPSPEAVGVSDMPKETKLNGQTRDPSAGSVPGDLSKRGGKR